jgi:hypothetical protein
MKLCCVPIKLYHINKYNINNYFFLVCLYVFALEQPAILASRNKCAAAKDINLIARSEAYIYIYIYIHIHNCVMQTALRKSIEERATLICDQQVELLRECYDECQRVSEMWPASSDSFSEALDTRVLNCIILEFTLCQAVPEPQKTRSLCGHPVLLAVL